MQGTLQTTHAHPTRESRAINRSQSHDAFLRCNQTIIRALPLSTIAPSSTTKHSVALAWSSIAYSPSHPVCRHPPDPPDHHYLISSLSSASLPPLVIDPSIPPDLPWNGEPSNHTSYATAPQAVQKALRHVSLQPAQVRTSTRSRR